MKEKKWFEHWVKRSTWWCWLCDISVNRLQRVCTNWVHLSGLNSLWLQLWACVVWTSRSEAFCCLEILSCSSSSLSDSPSSSSSSPLCSFFKKRVKIKFTKSNQPFQKHVFVWTQRSFLTGDSCVWCYSLSDSVIPGVKSAALFLYPERLRSKTGAGLSSSLIWQESSSSHRLLGMKDQVQLLVQDQRFLLWDCLNLVSEGSEKTDLRSVCVSEQRLVNQLYAQIPEERQMVYTGSWLLQQRHRSRSRFRHFKTDWFLTFGFRTCQLVSTH